MCYISDHTDYPMPQLLANFAIKEPFTITFWFHVAKHRNRTKKSEPIAGFAFYYLHKANKPVNQS